MIATVPKSALQGRDQTKTGARKQKSQAGLSEARKARQLAISFALILNPLMLHQFISTKRPFSLVTFTSLAPVLVLSPDWLEPLAFILGNGSLGIGSPTGLKNAHEAYHVERDAPKLEGENPIS